jgi:hypothetical protein
MFAASRNLHRWSILASIALAALTSSGDAQKYELSVFRWGFLV